MNSVELSIVIVNYNVKYFLENCLISVGKACASLDTEIIVFDNNSTDGSRDYLEKRFTNVRFIWNEENVGFANANNMAFQVCTGRYILFLNPDTIIGEDTLVMCLRYIHSNSFCGALGVKLIDGSGKFLKESKRSVPSPWNAFCRLTGIDTLFPANNLTAGYYASGVKHNATAAVDILPGAFLMMKKDVVEEVNGFDASYFMYGEDIDICYRLKKAGYFNFYFPQTTIIHFKGESTQKRAPTYGKHFYGAMHLFVHKHYLQPKALFMHGSIMAGKLLSRIKYRIIKKQIINVSVLRTVIVSSAGRFEEVVKILHNGLHDVKIIGRIAADNEDKEHNLGYINDIERIIRNNKIQQIIFCEGEIGNKYIIDIIQFLEGKSNFLFHETDSNSIVGSFNKNHGGLVISSS